MGQVSNQLYEQAVGLTILGGIITGIIGGIVSWFYDLIS